VVNPQDGILKPNVSAFLKR